MLIGEFENLFASLFKNHEQHIKIVKVLAKYRYRVGKTVLLAATGLVGGHATNRLQQLEDAGYIMSFSPLYHQRKGKYYRLIDEYSFLFTMG